MTTSKIPIATCLWFDKNAEEAAKFYAATFPNSHITAVHKSPADYPNGKAGDVLTVEFAVLGQPFVGLTTADKPSPAAGARTNLGFIGRSYRANS